MFATEADIDALIALQKRSMHRHAGFAVAVVCLGLILVLLCNRFGASLQASTGLIQAGTGFASLLGSGLPVMQILKCKDKIDNFALLKLKVNDLARQVRSGNKADLKWIDTIVRESIQKGITG